MYHTIYNFLTHLDFRFAKEAYTIHQFTFTAADVSFDSPVGVQMTYRKYVSDEYPEIIEDDDPNSVLGVKVQVRESKTFPEPGQPPVNILLGLPGTFISIVYPHPSSHSFICLLFDSKLGD